MKLSATLLSIIALASAVVAQSSSDPVIVVGYANGSRKTYKSGECIPVALNNGNIPATTAFAFQDLTCGAEGGFNCADGPKPPQDIPFPAGITVPNAFDVVRAVAQGAKCYPLGH